MANSDRNSVLRLLPLVVGGLTGTLLLINRWLTPNLLESQARSDAVGVIASAILILTGLLWQQIQPRLPESVELVGTEQFDLDPDLPEAVKVELAWATRLLLLNTVTQAIVIWYRQRVIVRRGILPELKQVTPGVIVKRVLETQKPVYLVALKVYPGKVEFDYLPENTQGVICQPIGDQGVMILGANAPRSYTQQDEQWIAGLAEKLDYLLATTDSPVGDRS